MEYEIEKKCPAEDLAAIRIRLESLGASGFHEIIEADTYYAHPSRDFVQTDEALRIRRVDKSVFITYKGPRLDRTTKTRREIELPLGHQGDTSQAAWDELLTQLGFTRVATVLKRRTYCTLKWLDFDLTATLDEVDQVGTYVEMEIMAADESRMEEAKAAIAALASELKLTGNETRSYLGLLLGGN